jgi:predicted esterase
MAHLLLVRASSPAIRRTAMNRTLFALGALTMLLLHSLAWGREPVGVLHTLGVDGASRSYFAYPPIAPEQPAPLLLLLHGSGGDGDSLVREWRRAADTHGIILIAPNAAEIDDASAHYHVDRSRLYLFGHSAGACWALQLVLLDPDLFAAVAVHAGLIPIEAHGLIDQARGFTPIQIQVGTHDRFFPVSMVRTTVDKLASSGFQVELIEIPRHDHDYYSASKRINSTAWEFLQNHSRQQSAHQQHMAPNEEGLMLPATATPAGGGCDQTEAPSGYQLRVWVSRTQRMER